MCRSSSDPDGPRTCAADSRTNFATSSAVLTDLHAQDNAVTAALSPEYTPSPQRRWQVTVTDPYGTPTGPARYLTDQAVLEIDSRAQDASSWDSDADTATGWTGCGYVVDGDYVRVVHIDHHPDET